MQPTTAIRTLKAIGAARGNMAMAKAYADARTDWPDREHVKAAVSGLEVGGMGGGRAAFADFQPYLRSQSIVDRLPMRRAVPNQPFLTQTAGAVAAWRAEGTAAPLSVGTFARADGLRLKSVTAITVAAEEVFDDPSADAEAWLAADLAAACGGALDAAFVDPDNTGSDSTPKSITADATPIVSSGGDAAAIAADLRLALAELAAAGSDLRAAHWIMPTTLAADLALLQTSAGPAFPTISALGGTLAGLPVVTSGSVPVTSGGAPIVLVDAGQVTYVEDVPIIRLSQQAMLEMSDAPTGDTLTPTGASATPVSLFQAGAMAVLANMPFNWQLRRAGMAQIITDVVVDVPAASSGA